MKDPYFDTKLCIERLMAEYHTHGKLIIAVDFDDTVFDFHGKGFAYDFVLDALKECQSLGFHIVLFTGVHPDQYTMQKTHLYSKGISITHVNENPIPLPFGNHGKMYYNLLLDDRAGLGQAMAILTAVIYNIKKEKVTIQ